MPAPLGHEPYNINGEGGRPPKYSKEEIDKFADELKEWFKNPFNIWLDDFCLEKDIDPDYMAEWAKQNERFGGAYKVAKQRQKSKLINGGLFNRFNTKIASLVLAVSHGYKDTDDSDKQVPTQNTYYVNYGSSVKVLPEALPDQDTTSAR